MSFYKKVLIGLLSTFSVAVSAAPWPNGKPIKIIQGFSPASAPQMLALEIAKILTEKTGASTFVESKQGANGNISAEFVAKSPPDGQTLYVATTGTMSINSSLYKRLSFDPKNDFQPIVLLGYVPNVIIVNNKLPMHSLKEFVSYAKDHPGKVNYGTSGVGSSQHLAMEQFSIEAGIKLTHIPYGTGTAVTDLMGGQVEAMFHQLPAALGLIKAGSVRALAVSTKTRVPVVQEVPTVAESGYPGFESVTWFGLFAPRGTSRAVVDRINVLVSDELKGSLGQKLQATGIIPASSSPEKLAQMVADDTVKWHGIVEKIGLQPN
jgi:tripartite-type tricarboxylate transporter receptor subunit TctC